jgi:hypothetical protein
MRVKATNSFILFSLSCRGCDDLLSGSLGGDALAQRKGQFNDAKFVPLLDSRVSARWSFDTSFRRRLLGIQQIMHRFDGLSDRTHKLHDMSFSNLDANLALLSENLKNTAAFYAESAKQVVDKIAELEA